MSPRRSVISEKDADAYSSLTTCQALLTVQSSLRVSRWESLFYSFCWKVMPNGFIFMFSNVFHYVWFAFYAWSVSRDWKHFSCFMCSHSLSDFASVWLLGLLLSKCLLCTLCPALREKSKPTPPAPPTPLSPSVLDVTFVLWQPIKAGSINVHMNEAKVITY